jgi:hypothetical protein
MKLSNEQIAQTLGVPLSRVQTYWPLIDQCLASLCKDYGDEIQIAALATIRVECPPFIPIHEYGTDVLHEKLYGHRKDLGDLNDGDGAKYAGRGFIQITGEFNYKHYGDLLGIDLVDNPDEALDPNVSASIFAAYFWEKKCGEAAQAMQWTHVRKLVNGGRNSLQPFLFFVQQLGTAAQRPDIAASAADQLVQAHGVAAGG